MIIKTLITSLTILVIYLTSISILLPKLKIEQHQWQSNSIKAENYIYAAGEYPNVIIGSSLANRITTDSLDGFYNFAFSGKGIFDGLRILTESDQLPKNVFIETNFVIRPEDKEFTSSVMNPIQYHLLKYIPALRSGKQPIPLLAQPLSYFISGSLYRIKLLIYTDYNSKKTAKSGELFDQLLANQVKGLSRKPANLDKSFESLKYYTDLLQSKGVNIIFFEMPMHCQLSSLAQPSLIRETFFKKFPPSMYKYIFKPDCSEYETTDGAHLNSAGALRYKRYFKSKVNCNYCLVN